MSTILCRCSNATYLLVFSIVFLAPLAAAGRTDALGDCNADSESGWISLFDGKSLDGWKSNEETPNTFVVEKGKIVVKGGRAHLFYTGPVQDADFENFEFVAEVKTFPGSNSGIYFHTQFVEKGWPSKGYEAQVNNSHKNANRSGSLFAVEDITQSLVNDKEWFEYRIIVNGNRIVLKIDGKTTVDYTQPENPKRKPNMAGRILGSGAFALQAHDPTCNVFYRNIRVKPLP